MVDRTQVLAEWADVVLKHPVPSHLYDHQVDAMALLKEGKNVFLGKIFLMYLVLIYDMILQPCPQGQGKHSLNLQLFLQWKVSRF